MNNCKLNNNTRILRGQLWQGHSNGLRDFGTSENTSLSTLKTMAKVPGDELGENESETFQYRKNSNTITKKANGDIQNREQP